MMSLLCCCRRALSALQPAAIPRSLPLVTWQKRFAGTKKSSASVSAKKKAAEEGSEVIDWSKLAPADYVGKTSDDGFLMIGTCHGTSHIKGQEDPPMYENRYYPDWLFTMPLEKVDISEMDPSSVEFAKRLRGMRIRHQNYLAEQGLDIGKKKKKKRRY